MLRRARNPACFLVLLAAQSVLTVAIAAPSPVGAPGGSAQLSTGRAISARVVVTEGARIRGLRINSPQKLTIEEQEESGGTFSYFARLSGDFTALEDSVLVLNRQDPIAKIASGKLTQTFSVRIPIVADKNPILLEALAPSGRIERLPLVIEAQFEKSAGLAETLLSGWVRSVAIGPSVILHRETAAPTFRATNFTFKLTADRRLPGPWSVGALVFFTAFPVSSSIPTLSPKFLGMSVRGSYQTAWLRRPWSLGWSAGFYYTTLFGGEPTYGFTNIHGLQPIPYPTLTRRLSGVSSLAFTAKYSPILATFPKGLLDHRQAALGLRYNRSISKTRLWFVGADYSRFDSKFGDATITSESLSLGVGITF